MGHAGVTSSIDCRGWRRVINHRSVAATCHVGAYAGKYVVVTDDDVGGRVDGFPSKYDFDGVPEWAGAIPC